MKFAAIGIFDELRHLTDSLIRIERSVMPVFFYSAFKEIKMYRKKTEK